MRPRGIVILLFPLLSACGPEYEQIQGKHLLYEYSAEMHPCAGTAAYLDGMVPFLERVLTLQAPGRLRYSWIAQGHGFAPLGGEPGRGRAVGNHAWSLQPINVHELAHIMTGGMPARFFTEGVAEAVSLSRPGLPVRYAFDDSELAEAIFDPGATMLATRLEGVNYTTAAMFVLYLLVIHGPKKFHEFYRSLGGPVTMPWLRQQFQRAYGLALDEEIAIFRAGIPNCELGTHAVPLPECSAATLPWTSETSWEYSVSMACDDPGVVGGIGPDSVWQSFYPITLEVTEPGTYHIAIDNEAVTAGFGPCFGCPWEHKDIFLEREAMSIKVTLDTGTYYWRVNAQSDESPAVSLTVRRL